MLRKFNPLIEDIPTPFCEDIYLVDRRGKVLACRQRIRRNFDSIFSIIGKEDLEFVRQNILFSTLCPFLAVKSKEGLMIIDNSLFFEFGVLMVIIPHMSAEYAVSIIKTTLRQISLPSPTVRSLLDSADCRGLNCEQKALEKMTLALYHSAIAFETHGKTNAEIVDVMVDIANNISGLVGCKLKINVHGVAVFDIKNELSESLYKYMMLSLCFAARSYSANRGANVDIYIDELGVSVCVGFDLAQDYLGCSIDKEAPELVNIITQANNDGFIFDISLDGNVFSACGYPWQRIYEQEHLKKDPKKLDYESNDKY